MSNSRDELPTIDLSTLSRVTGGASTDMSSMMLPLMMWKNKQQQQSAAAAAAASAAAAPVAPPQPKITLNGVPQSPSSISSAGTSYSTPSLDDSDLSDF